MESPRSTDLVAISATTNEGFGFEFLYNKEELKNEASNSLNKTITSTKNAPIIIGHSASSKGSSRQCKGHKNCTRSFPPLISSLGRTGNPLVSFKSHRHNGRLVLRRVRIPIQEDLHAWREDGRLRLSFIEQCVDEGHDLLQEEQVEVHGTRE